MTGTISILIADSSEDFPAALGEILGPRYTLHICSEGNAALALLHALRPDFLILDLSLPGMDGISLLHNAAAAGIFPMVLATTTYRSAYVEASLQELGVQYLMVKPCCMKSIVARVMDLTQRIHLPRDTPTAPQLAVGKTLRELGFEPGVQGWEQLQYAIPLFALDRGQSITKELYPKVGRLCNCDGSCVEHSVRTAIRRAWDTREESAWSKYFPTGTRPSNKKFIARLAEALPMNEP